MWQYTGPDQFTGGRGEALPAGEGGPPEAPSEGPAGGAVPEARFYTIWPH